MRKGTGGRRPPDDDIWWDEVAGRNAGTDDFSYGPPAWSDDAVCAAADGNDLRRMQRQRVGLAPVALTCLVCLLLGFGLAVLAAAKSAEAPVETARLETSEPPQWIDIVHPFEIFGLTAPDLGKSTKIYQARRYRDGGGRQDTLGFGDLNEEGPFLRLTIYRPGSETLAPVPFFVDMVRATAAADFSIAHNRQPRETATRFGGFEIADLDLAAKNGTPTPCLGFRSIATDAPVRMTGFACGGKDKPLSQQALACLIERLDLNSAGEDQALARFFAAAELKRNPACAGMTLAPTPVHANWLDQADARPQLRLRKTH